MIDRIYAHMQAMQVLSKSQEATADNLANINTPGFKGNKMFYRMFKENIDGREVIKSVPMQRINLNQGVLEPTGNEFDLGINGDGFFMVEQDGQNMLTRDGRFHLDPDGFLVNGSGAKVMGNSGEIDLSDYFMAQGDGEMPKLEIAKDGTISLNDRPIDKLRMVNVEDSSQLQRKGSAYFTVEDESMLTDDNTGTIMQGYFEKGNVEPLAEMVDMMQNTKMFESQQRALKTSDELLSRVSTQLGKY
ncbi:flagellar hook-basal body protein [Gracilimonas mengyeensis]|uniref:Flagellar basal-body rod protein FlgF/flagellar basal-body rod protein FlgG n=1 Tax=Gracilimonas mengyeensis TaxID=1302730 RepID=A0A521FHK8_9BACT|nr:flagellar hook basal-body protein [Gracilimonas mengyeensis]SMO95708.1 flagellar basal-body rod protein FlgF/flagellar basal-body rod protein FlgG [Gracilimonas mengyeensis]